MFTGIVEELGTVESRDGARLRIRATEVVQDAHVGDSIAVARSGTGSPAIASKIARLLEDLPRPPARA